MEFLIRGHVWATTQLGELELMHMFWLSPRWQLSNLLVHFLYETGLELGFSQTTVRVVRPLQAWPHHYIARASAALASTKLLQTWQKIENTQTLLTENFELLVVENAGRKIKLTQSLQADFAVNTAMHWMLNDIHTDKEDRNMWICHTSSYVYM